MPFLARYPNKTTSQGDMTGISSPTATISATRALLQRFQPTLPPMSVVMRQIKNIIIRDKAGARSPRSATNTALTLEQSSRHTLQRIPKSRLAEHSTDAQAAYQFIHDELQLESDPNMNMASYGKHLNC